MAPDKPAKDEAPATWPGPAVHRGLQDPKVREYGGDDNAAGLRRAGRWTLGTAVVEVAYWPGPPHRTSNAGQLFAPLYRTKSRRRVDVNSKPRESLHRAVSSAGGAATPPGKVVAELTFGFWRYLSSAAHEKTLWVPCLHRCCPPGTDRRDVDGPVGRLHDVRNRVAHHEPLLQTSVAGRLADLIEIGTLLDAHLGQHLSATTRVTSLLATRP